MTKVSFAKGFASIFAHVILGLIMIGKGSKIYSIFAMKCPSCHEGDFFKKKGAYNLKHLFEMYERCPKCNQTYEPEPNFYYGAMYVSYAFTVAIFVAVLVICQVFLGMTLWPTIWVLITVLVLGGPYLFRLARITWLNFFVKYKKK